MTDQTKAPAVASGSGLGKPQHGTSSEAQRLRLLARLKQGPLTTIEARRDLDILMPAARVFELRERGFGIFTYRTLQSTDSGRSHSLALYALQTVGGAPIQPKTAANEERPLQEIKREAA